MDRDLPPQPPTSAPAPPAPGAQPQSVEVEEQIQIVVPSSGDSHGAEGRDNLPEESSTERFVQSPASEGHPALPRSGYGDERFPPLPIPRNRDGLVRTSRHSHMSTVGLPFRDRFAPIQQKRLTVCERIQPTIEHAEEEKKKSEGTAWLSGLVLNLAIGLQILLGALTTAIAASISSAKQAQISTAVLGGLSTLVASYLARARGSGEPEASSQRAKLFEQFLRECRAFQLDHGHETTDPGHGSSDHARELDHRVIELRRRFEDLLGNMNTDNKLAPKGAPANAPNVGSNGTAPSAGNNPNKAAT